MKIPDDFDFETRDLEQNEELEAVAWAENNGWLVRKIQYIGRASCPDRLFIGYGHILLVELKRPTAVLKKGGGLSKGQKEEFERFSEHGVTVPVLYSAADVQVFLKGYMPS